MSEQLVEWNPKKGYHETYTYNDDGKRISLGQKTAGPKPNYEQVLYKYFDYLDRAIKAAPKPEKGKSVDINSHAYNLKLFILEELGNHYTSFQVKTIIKGFNDSRKVGTRITVLRVGAQGRAAKQAQARIRAGDYLAEKYKHLIGVQHDT